MAEHEEQCLAARFQFFKGVIHQPQARAEALTIRPDRQGREHRGLQSIAVSLLQPHPREDDVTYEPTRILGEPLSKMQPPARSASRNAAVSSDPVDLKASYTSLRVDAWS